MFDFSLDKNIGLNTNVVKDNYDLLIIGGGPGAINASIYAYRKNLKVLMVAKNMGGQLVDSGRIDNYLGYYDLRGEQLFNHFMDHLNNFDIDIARGVSVLSLKKNGERNFSAKLSTNKEVTAKSVIIATGGTPKKLNIPGEERLVGKGVSYCVECDGDFYRDKDIVIVGGGNSALEAALDMSNIAKSVHIIEIMNDFSGDGILVDQVLKTDNITYEFNTKVLEINGNNNIESIKVMKDDVEKEIQTEGIFVKIGANPTSDFVKDFVEVNKFREIITDNLQNTSVKGVYAVGDVTNYPHKQVIVAVSNGAVAALSANKYIREGE